MAPNAFGDAWRAHLAMLLFAFLISTSFTVGAEITHAIDPIALTFLRFLLAALIFAGLMVAARNRFRIAGWQSLLRYGWLGLLLMVYFVAMFEALRWTSALSTGAIFTLAPLMTMVISRFLVRQRSSVLQLFALLVAGIGALWVMFNGDADLLLQFSIGRGELIFVIGCLSYAAFSPSVRWLHGSDGLIELTFWTLCCGTILLGIFGWSAIASTPWLGVPWWAYLGVLHLALFTTAASFYLIQYASLRLPSTKVMAYTYLIPAFVVVQNTITGQAVPTSSVLVGVAVISAAMVLLQRAPAPA